MRNVCVLIGSGTESIKSLMMEILIFHSDRVLTYELRKVMEWVPWRSCGLLLWYTRFSFSLGKQTTTSGGVGISRCNVLSNYGVILIHLNPHESLLRGYYWRGRAKLFSAWTRNVELVQLHLVTWLLLFMPRLGSISWRWCLAFDKL